MVEMNITSAKYVRNIEDTGNTDTLRAIIDDVEMLVPLDTANRHYQAILEWVDDGNTIEEAD
tara:strand:+ start:394 stop:579 length:186 start_codon:yes stop_codon:yes gene_type:complete